MKRSESGFFMILFSLMWLLSQPGQAVDTFGKSVGSPLAGLKPMRHQACYETSRHNKHRVQVEPGVFVEVLDWEGKGEPLVLLAGLGNKAHMFDDVAYQFTDRFRVLGITRRGFGDSSKPTEATISRPVRGMISRFSITSGSLKPTLWAIRLPVLNCSIWAATTLIASKGP